MKKTNNKKINCKSGIIAIIHSVALRFSTEAKLLEQFLKTSLMFLKNLFLFSKHKIE